MARKYIWGIGLAYLVDDAVDALVYYSDGLGSVRAIADASGQVIQTYQTDEFGVPLQSVGSSTQPFQYTSEQSDAESGFYFLRARIYDPNVSRFLQADAMALDLRNPQALNLYTYGLNNPLVYVDPSGLSSVQILKRWGDTDNECLSSGGGALGGNVLNVTCFNILGQTVTPKIVWVAGRPVLVLEVLPMGYGPNDTVGDILKGKKGSIKNAPLDKGSPTWSEILNMTWKQIEDAARQRRPEFQTIRKLLTD